MIRERPTTTKLSYYGLDYTFDLTVVRRRLAELDLAFVRGIDEEQESPRQVRGYAAHAEGAKVSHMTLRRFVDEGRQITTESLGRILKYLNLSLGDVTARQAAGAAA